MKTILHRKKIIIFTFFLSCTTVTIHAQFLKNIINSVKNTAQNHVNNSASNATDKALNKIDPTQKPSTPNSGDKSDKDRVLGGFAKAAEDNPNDTSTADLLAKSLANMMGGNGVSAEDSAKAINAFKPTGSKGNTRCVYYEVTNSITTDKGVTSNSITKYWFTGNGHARGEMNLAAMIAGAAGYHINSKPIVMLSHADMPNYGITLDDENKEYSLNIIDQALLNKDASSYSVHEIGSENVNGYPCKHILVKGHKMMMDMWMSTAVPGYDVYQKAAATASSGSSASYYDALKKAGVTGYPVKIIVENSGASMTLTKATFIGVSNSFFEIPANYKMAANNGVITNLMKAGAGGHK